MRLTLFVAMMLCATGCKKTYKQPEAPLFCRLGAGGWGYADRTGQMVIPFQFEACNRFSEGLAPVSVAGRWGYIDAAGKLVITPRFDLASAFEDGVAVVKVGDEARLITTAGEFASDERFDEVQAFSGGLAPAIPWKSEKWGFIDRKGRFAVRSQFSTASPFTDGLAAVCFGEGVCGFVDSSGRLTIGGEYRDVRPFTDGLAAFRDKSGKWGYVSKTGAIQVPAQFEDAKAFSGGVAAVKTRDRWGFIGTNGEFTIPAQFLRAESFGDGLAAVFLDEAWSRQGEPLRGRFAYIKRDGQIAFDVPNAWRETEEPLSRFANGAAEVFLDPESVPGATLVRAVMSTDGATLWTEPMGEHHKLMTDAAIRVGLERRPTECAEAAAGWKDVCWRAFEASGGLGRIVRPYLLNGSKNPRYFLLEEVCEQTAADISKRCTRGGLPVKLQGQARIVNVLASDMIIFCRRSIPGGFGNSDSDWCFRAAKALPDVLRQ